MPTLDAVKMRRLQAPYVGRAEHLRIQCYELPAIGVHSATERPERPRLPRRLSSRLCPRTLDIAAYSRMLDPR